MFWGKQGFTFILTDLRCTHGFKKVWKTYYGMGKHCDSHVGQMAPMLFKSSLMDGDLV